MEVPKYLSSMLEKISRSIPRGAAHEEVYKERLYLEKVLGQTREELLSLQSAEGGQKPMTLEEYMNLMMEHNPKLEKMSEIERVRHFRENYEDYRKLTDPSPEMRAKKSHIESAETYEEMVPEGIPQDMMIEFMREDMPEIRNKTEEEIRRDFKSLYVKYLELQWKEQEY